METTKIKPSISSPLMDETINGTMYTIRNQRRGTSYCRKRAPIACWRCRTRKLRCDMTNSQGFVCTNCRLDGERCFVKSRKRHKSSGELDKVNTLQISQSPQVTTHREYFSPSSWKQQDQSLLGPLPPQQASQIALECVPRSGPRDEEQRTERNLSIANTPPDSWKEPCWSSHPDKLLFSQSRSQRGKQQESFTPVDPSELILNTAVEYMPPKFSIPISLSIGDLACYKSRIHIAADSNISQLSVNHDRTSQSDSTQVKFSMGHRVDTHHGFSCDRLMTGGMSCNPPRLVHDNEDLFERLLSFVYSSPMESV